MTELKSFLEYLILEIFFEILSVNEDLSLKIKIDEATKNIFFGELV